MTGSAQSALKSSVIRPSRVCLRPCRRSARGGHGAVDPGAAARKAARSSRATASRIAAGGARQAESAGSPAPPPARRSGARPTVGRAGRAAGRPRARGFPRRSTARSRLARSAQLPPASARAACGRPAAPGSPPRRRRSADAAAARGRRAMSASSMATGAGAARQRLVRQRRAGQERRRPAARPRDAADASCRCPPRPTAPAGHCGQLRRARPARPRASALEAAPQKILGGEVRLCANGSGSCRHRAARASRRSRRLVRLRGRVQIKRAVQVAAQPEAGQHAEVAVTGTASITPRKPNAAPPANSAKITHTAVQLHPVAEKARLDHVVVRAPGRARTRRPPERRRSSSGNCASDSTIAVTAPIRCRHRG